jgi:hypothetical protein
MGRKMNNILLEKLRSIIAEEIETALDDQIEELRGEPEFASIDSFIESKIDDDVFDYNFLELHALARNITQRKLGKNVDVTEAAPSDINHVKTTLSDMGFTFIGRKPVKNVRGFNSPSHGTHPFAGSGGGGSGFGSDFGGTTFTSYGGGPGALGGGYDWDPNDSKNLSMGSKRRR